MVVVVQVLISSLVATAVPALLGCRHLPEFGFEIVPLAWRIHFWATVLLQVYMSTTVPLAVPEWSTSKHWLALAVPTAVLMVPWVLLTLSLMNVHCWAGEL